MTIWTFSILSLYSLDYLNLWHPVSKFPWLFEPMASSLYIPLTIWTYGIQSLNSLDYLNLWHPLSLNSLDYLNLWHPVSKFPWLFEPMASSLYISLTSWTYGIQSLNSLDYLNLWHPVSKFPWLFCEDLDQVDVNKRTKLEQQ